MWVGSTARPFSPAHSSPNVVDEVVGMGAISSTARIDEHILIVRGLRARKLAARRAFTATRHLIPFSCRHRFTSSYTPDSAATILTPLTIHK